LAVTARGFAETRSWARTTDETLAEYTTLLAAHGLAGHGLAGGAAAGNNAACAAR
jgi:hypothetical protein